MPLITCEMRWFLEGALPEEVERWFQSSGEPVATAWREDRYLLPGVADMGIKQREGRIEIKGRTAKLGAHAITSEIEGNAERWCKWSYEAGSLASAFRFCLEDERTVVVGKGRLQRHFLLEPDGRWQETPQRDLARRGFSIELTRIRLPSGEAHWSLGIEASPDDPALLSDLLGALRNLLQDFPLPLPRKRSRSYPRWLAERSPDQPSSGGTSSQRRSCQLR